MAPSKRPALAADGAADARDPVPVESIGECRDPPRCRESVVVEEQHRIARARVAEAGLTGHDLRWLIPHQANTRIIQAVGERLDAVQITGAAVVVLGVAIVVGPGDRVYVINRGEHPMMVFEADGTFVRSWGEGVFTRAHGVTLGPDGNLYCADDDGHRILVCSPQGEVLSTIGGLAPAQSGKPFNRPTQTIVHPRTGDLYITDGYGNHCIHRYSPDGKLLAFGSSRDAKPGERKLFTYTMDVSSLNLGPQ